MDFKKLLRGWYSVNKRDLPWRDITNPYHIWVSEVILQQTRVAQGIGYYYRFLNEFPTITSLALAKEDKVLKVWQGLGYYTRARNLQKAAVWLMTNSNGELPKTYDSLLEIPGIGPYSAGAIASFAFGLAVPAIDGNVYRIVARIFGVFASTASATGKKEFNDIVYEVMDKDNPAQFNQALLDFGALQCTPRKPNCVTCPFNSVCYAYRNNTIESLPVKVMKGAVRSRFFVYLIVKYKDSILMSKRTAKDIWHSLYEFPLIEVDDQKSLESFQNSTLWRKIFGKSGVYINKVSPVITHKLSHQTLNIMFVTLTASRLSQWAFRTYSFVSTNNVGDFSVPVVIDNYLAAEPLGEYL
jgi:A/G-specific adenine glycosylase